MRRTFPNARPLPVVLLGAAGAVMTLLAAPDSARALPTQTESFDAVLGHVRKGLRRMNGTDARGFSLPTAAAIDTSRTPYALYVSDFQNARILVFRDVDKVGPGSEPDLIIGQDDPSESQRYRAGRRAFAFVSGITVDKDGTLWVADSGNGRVLGFRWPLDPSKTRDENTTADVLIGNTSYDIPAGKNYFEVACNGGALFGGAAGKSTESSFCSPEGLAADSAGNLYVVDKQNSRVVFFPAPIPEQGAKATRVYGQASLVGTPGLGPSCNRVYQVPGGLPTVDSLCRPTHAIIDERSNPPRLIVADTDNNRVVLYNDPAKDSIADAVIGQPGYITSTPGVGTERLRSPQGVALDPGGVLWISDTGNHRLLGLRPGFAAIGPGVDMIIGQLDAGSNLANQGITGRPTPLPTAASLSRPRPPVFLPDGRLVLPDQDNNRVLIYPKAEHQAVAAIVIGQNDFNHGTEARTKSTGLSYPVGIAVDRRSGEPPHVYVADYGNSRVLGYWDLAGLRDGRPADLVIGQRNFNDYSCNGGGGAGPATLCWPRGVAVDGNGDLWVVDTWNHRVVRFPRPFDRLSQRQTADLVLGQGSLVNGLYNGNATATPSARGLYSPTALTFGLDGVLWVSDRDNNRVVGFVPPFKTGMAATRLLIGNNLTAFTQPGCPTPGGGFLCSPAGLAIDGDNNLWVADRDNNRVTLYSTIADNTGLLSPIPMAILGQPLVTSVSPNQGGTPSARTLRGPESVSVELKKNGARQDTVAIVVADTGNNRVLVYDPVKAGFQPAATKVIGQVGAFDKVGYNTDQVNFELPANLSRGFWLPAAVLAVPEALLIADSGNTMKVSVRLGSAQAVFDGTGNNRVVLFRGPSFPMPSADAATPGDLATPMDLSGTLPQDLSTITPVPVDMATPKMEQGGGGCAVGGRGGVSSALLGLLGLCAVGLVLCRKRQA